MNLKLLYSCLPSFPESWSRLNAFSHSLHIGWLSTLEFQIFSFSQNTHNWQYLTNRSSKIMLLLCREHWHCLNYYCLCSYRNIFTLLYMHSALGIQHLLEHYSESTMCANELWFLWIKPTNKCVYRRTLISFIFKTLDFFRFLSYHYQGLTTIIKTSVHTWRRWLP